MCQKKDIKKRDHTTANIAIETFMMSTMGVFYTSVMFVSRVLYWFFWVFHWFLQTTGFKEQNFPVSFLVFGLAFSICLGENC